MGKVKHADNHVHPYHNDADRALREPGTLEIFMAKGEHLSRHQQGIVKRYYRNIDTISLTKLGELVSEICVCTDDKKLDKLWERARLALEKIDVKESAVQRVLSTRDVKGLAEIVNKLA